MHVKHLTLSNFRNYTSENVVLSPGINLIIGKNGQGKTSLVEAILFSSTLKAPRHGTYQQMIKVDQNQAIIQVLAKFNDRENMVELELNKATPNRARINRGETQRVTDVLGYINTVAFTPADDQLVHGDPEERRDFLNDLLIQFSPRLAGVLADYARVLKQRNSLLKSSKNLPANSPGLLTLDAWDESLVSLGTEIIAHRFELVEKLKPYVAEIYKSIASDSREATPSLLSTVLAEGFELSSESAVLNTGDKAFIATKFHERLKLLRSRELERGVTLVGPHRDDLLLKLGPLEARGYISFGEAWTYSLALKLASAALLRKEAKAGDPILILDDVFSSLDDERLKRLLDYVSEFEQVIITDAIRGRRSDLQAAAIFEIEEGKVTQIQ